MNEVFDLKYNPGNQISILKVSETEGILFIRDREEVEGVFVVDGKKKIPIVSFKMPPETCGVEETQELSFLYK